jgi:succinoglycan biosynthesis protein ExoV
MSFKLVSYNAPHGNVGDDFSHWLFSRALGDRLRPDGDIPLFGVGSILTTAFEAEARTASTRVCAVFGSGARGPNSLPDLSSKGWNVYCVRGPLTARIAGLACDVAVADPAVLTPRLMPVPHDETGPVGIVPYFRASDAAWRKIAEKLGWRVISPRNSVESFIAELTRCSRVWCESMHGAIFADAYGVPWRPVCATNVVSEGRTHAFKWTDWSAAMGLGFDPLTGIPLPERVSGAAALLKQRIKIEVMAARLAKADRQNRHLLSDRQILSDRQDRLLELMDRMCRELTGAPSDLR